MLLRESHQLSVRRPRTGLGQVLAVRKLLYSAGGIGILPERVPRARLGGTECHALSVACPDRHGIVGFRRELFKTVCRYVVQEDVRTIARDADNHPFSVRRKSRGLISANWSLQRLGRTIKANPNHSAIRRAD